MKTYLMGTHFLILGFALLPLSSLAQEAAASQGPSDPVELEAFIDGIMAFHFETNCA